MSTVGRSFVAVMNTSGTSSNTVTVGKPGETADGDLLLAMTTGPVATVTPPAGWTFMGSLTNGTVQSNFYKKIAASEGASYVFTWSVSDAVGAFVFSFYGGYDVHLWDFVATGTDSTPSCLRTEAGRNSIGLNVISWADTATNSVTINQGSEQFDVVSANTGSTVFRGLAAYLYGPPSVNDIVNIGDALPGATFTMNNAPTGAICYQLLLDEKAPDAEAWSATNGDFDVELKLDEVSVGSTGSITTEFKGDLTGQVAAITASGENLPNEGAAKLADGLTTTKWLVFTATASVKYDFGASVTKTVRRYRLTSANDTPARDPMNWILEGSQNSVDWTTLDTRTNESFASRFEVKEFKVATPGAYRYYRLNISANKSSGATAVIQLAEWRLSAIDVWEDITSKVNEESKIRITRGLQGSSGRSDFTRAYVDLNNTDGRFSLRNPDGLYHGALQRNNQVRIAKAYGTKSLQLQGEVQLEGTDMAGDAVRCALTSALQITGDIDIRIDFEPESWRDKQQLCGIALAVGGDEGWSVYLDGDGTPHLTWHDGGANFFDVAAEFPMPQKTRQTLRVTLDVNNGAGGKGVSFYYDDTISGQWTQLGETITSTGTTSIGYSGGALCIGHVTDRARRGIHGLVYNFELRNGINGTLVTDVDFTTLANGTHSFTDSNSNRWVTVNNAVVSNRRYRFHGEIAEWPLAWDPTGTWITASATGAGVQKRLERGNNPLSVMRRHHTKGIIADPGAFERFASPAAYWPLEDKKGAFTIASGLPSRPFMTITGSPEFEAADGGKFNESDALIKLNGARMSGRVVGGTSSYADIRWMHYSPSDMTAGSVVLEFFSTGSLKRFEVSYPSSNNWRVRGFDEDDSGTAAWDSGSRAVTTSGELMHVQLIIDQDGLNVLVTMNAFDVYGASLGTWTDTFLVATMGKIARININPEGDVSNTYIGHMAMYGIDSPAFGGSEMNAHHYETAGNRIKRMCDEEGIDFRFIGDLDQTQFMGYQDIETPFSVMSSAAVSDDGYLTDPLDAFGIEYRTSRSLLNQAAHLELSYTAGELSGELSPLADDSYIVNDFTANRGDAGGARFRRTDGGLSVNDPPDGVGPYEDSQSYSLAHEGQCVDIASWQVHKGTLDEERYTKIELALENLRIAADSATIERILLLDVGDRLDVTDTPSHLPPHDIRQIVIGYEEWFDKFQHNFTLNTLPERVHEAAEYDAWDHFDTDASEVYQDITSAATSFDVRTTDGPNWTANPKAMPFDILVDQEVMRVTAPGTGTTVNPFFDTTVSDWTAQASTITRDTTYVHPHPDALASLKITPDGSLGAANALAPSPGKAVTPGNRYLVCGWVFAPDGYDACRVTVNWHDSGNTYLSTSSVTSDNVPAATWTYLEEPVTAPASAAFGRALGGQTNSPTGSEVTYWWSVRLVDTTNIATASYSSDTFDRANDLVTPGSTNGGTISAWTEDSGTWGIISNNAYITASADSVMTIPGSADAEWIEVTVPTWTAGVAQIVFRYTDTSNQLRWGGTVGSAALLQQVVAGVVTTIADAETADYTLAAGDVLAVRCNGSVIECFINGSLAVCASDTTQETATRVGLRLTDTSTRLDNFYYEASSSLQTYTVERGRNAAAKPHKSLAGVKLYQTPYRGL